MPISIEEFQLPYFVRIQERYPLSYNKADRYNEIWPPNFEARYNHNEGEVGVFKQGGYNPHHQSTRVERVNLKTEDITLKPY